MGINSKGKDGRISELPRNYVSMYETRLANYFTLALGITPFEPVPEGNHNYFRVTYLPAVAVS